jgi:hypothetical protein
MKHIMKYLYSVSFVCIAFTALSASLLSCRQSADEISLPASPSWFSANAAASPSMDIQLRWAAVSGAESYVLSVSTDKFSTYTVISDISGTTYEYKGNGETEKTDLWFEVAAVNSAGISTSQAKASVRFIPAAGKTNSDWLVLFYGDGDVAGVNVLWYAEQNFCRALDEIGSTAASKIKVVSLWDGSAKAVDTNVDDSGSYADNMTGAWSDSYLLELAAGTPAEGKPELSYTDLSATASWMKDADGNREVDMSDYETLANFLIWAKNRYSTSPAHTIVMFVDHGAGPMATSSSRAACSDDTSADKSSIIYSDQLRKAFTEAGYGSGSKAGMVYFDMCLEGSFEEAYEFKDIADYYLASENVESTFVPESSTYNLIKNIAAADSSKTDVLESIARAQVKAVSDSLITNHFTADYWKSYYPGWTTPGKITADGITEIGGVALDPVTAKYMCDISQTLSCTRLSEADELATALDNLAVAISAGSDEQKKNIACGYFKSDAPLTHALIYGGSAYYLYDIGKFAYEMQHLDTVSDWGKNLAGKAEAVTDVLGKTIVAAWSDCYRASGTQGLYFHGSDTDTGNYGENEFKKENNWYGLTIAGGRHDWKWFYGYKTSSSVTENISDLPDTVSYSNLDFVRDHPAWASMRSGILSLR